MPTQYDPTKRKFIDGNAYVSHLETRAAIDRLTEFIKRQSAKYAKAFNDGKMSPDEFNAAMRELLKAGHIVSASVGRGGRDRMTAGDWGRVGRKIKWQYGFLTAFVKKLKAGKPINVRSRAASYASSIFISYSDSRRVANEEFLASGGDANPKKEVLCKRELNAAESCVECAEYASQGWIPVSEQPEIGELACGDFCKCMIIFEDEV